VRIQFLGTSAGVPTRERNVTSQAVQFDDGRIWLLDCGEGTQHQLMRSGLRPSRIERILITHLHGDHCFGLPGLLASMGVNGRTDPVALIGPRGIKEMIDVTVRLSATSLPFNLEISELADDGGDYGVHRNWRIDVRPLRHRVASFGYSVHEDERPGRFHPERAVALGLQPGPLFKRLQDGQSVSLPDGRIIAPEQVADPRRPGRHLVLLGDTCDSNEMIPIARNCDVVVHEVTYDARFADKAQQWGHSTTTMAGRFAAAIAAKTLIMTHFSSRYGDSEPGELTTADLIRETAACCPGTQVLAATDMWSYEVPFSE
jgi:ribonuclease Z